MPPLDLTALTAEITRMETVDAGAGAALHAFFDAAEANKTDPAAIQALVDRGRAASDALVAAISATTTTVVPTA